MLLVLQEFLAGNAEVVKTIPHLEAIVHSLKALEEEIQASSIQQMVHRYGEGTNKKLLKANLLRHCAEVSVKLAAYATLDSDQVLLYEIKTSVTALGRMEEGELTAFGGILHDRGTRYLDRAAAYGLLAQNLADLEASRQAFAEASADPRMAIIKWKTATSNLGDLFRQMNGLLKKSDILAEITRFSHPDFHTGYRTARKIVDHASRSLQLIITVTDKESKQPLPGARCRLAPAEHPEHLLVTKKSAAKGSIKVKTLDGGNYLLTVSNPGYQKITHEVFVTKGKFMRVAVELEKAE